jgi:hypothetical protein
VLQRNARMAQSCTEETAARNDRAPKGVSTQLKPQPAASLAGTVQQEHGRFVVHGE